ncbi:T9SS type A sorting domain-containing protein [Psychroserpens sp. AS72]|uniref:T9SS type A sorting domain-containing protein n=1 Tax=Psychroserpens sp. AS72 TaxID=3135775 RepID=UPI00317A3B99
MKHFYTLICLSFLTLTGFAQNSDTSGEPAGYTFGIVQNVGYNFSVIATPNFDTTNSDVSDIGFALMLPAGNADVTNVTAFNTRAWTVTQVTQADFQLFGADSNNRDGFAMNLPPGQTILSHTAGTPFVLVSFDISNSPTSGMIEILINTDPIAIALGGAIDSFYNTNLLDSGTNNYFSGITTGQESFMFNSLSIDEVMLEDSSITIYPNPTSDVINIITTTEIDTIELFDVTGKRVLSKSQTNKIKVNHLPIGVYLLKVYSARGSFTKKVVIN